MSDRQTLLVIKQLRTLLGEVRKEREVLVLAPPGSERRGGIYHYKELYFNNRVIGQIEVDHYSLTPGTPPNLDFEKAIWVDDTAYKFLPDESTEERIVLWSGKTEPRLYINVEPLDGDE